jgi:hypothetical protein
MNLFTLPISELNAHLTANYRNVHPCNIDRAIYSHDHGDYVEIHDDDMREKVDHVMKTVDLCIENSDVGRFAILAREFPWLDFPKLAMKTLKGSSSLYVIAKQRTTVFEIARACVIEGEAEVLETILSRLPTSNQDLIYAVCRTAYQSVTFSTIPRLDDIHSVLIKYANPNDHPDFERSVISLMECEEKAHPIYLFIISHPEYKWEGTSSLDTLSKLTSIHLARMKAVLHI